MLRVRLVAIAFLAAFVVGLGFLPVVFVWTFVAGNTATARVTACRHGKHLDCSGRWQDTKGGHGQGHISGVDEGDIGRTVDVRVGPLGPYAGGPVRSLPMLLTALPLLLAPPFLFVTMRRILGPGRAAARRLLAEPPGDATLLLVPRTWANDAIGVTDTGGAPRLSFAKTDAAPPGVQPAELPGRRPRMRQQSAFRAAAGLSREATSYAVAADPGGSPMFVVERRGFADHEPETWLLDTAWIPQAVVRRVETLPARFELLRADGTPLGTIGVPEGLRSGAFLTRDAEGRQHAVMAAYGRKWVVRVEPGAPPLLRDVTLAFLLDAARLLM